jgi:hypothetical protein
MRKIPCAIMKTFVQYKKGWHPYSKVRANAGADIKKNRGRILVTQNDAAPHHCPQE